MTSPEREMQVEVAALRIILSNLVARHALRGGGNAAQAHAIIDDMKDECKRAAQLSRVGSAGSAERDRVVSQMQDVIEAFFKGITIE